VHAIGTTAVMTAIFYRLKGTIVFLCPKPVNYCYNENKESACDVIFEVGANPDNPIYERGVCNMHPDQLFARNMDEKDVLRNYRSKFHIPPNTIYLDGNSLGLMPIR